MKKLFAFLAVIGILSFGVSTIVSAQQEEATADTGMTAVDTAQTQAPLTPIEDEEAPAEVPLHTVIKAKFIEGGASFMGIILLCLIFGLALAIERIIYLNLATTNTDKLLDKLGTADTGKRQTGLFVAEDTLLVTSDKPFNHRLHYAGVQSIVVDKPDRVENDLAPAVVKLLGRTTVVVCRLAK